MKQILQTYAILFLTLLLASLAPAAQLPASDCQGYITVAKSMPACCQAAAAMAESSMCSESAATDHGCPQGGWCQVEGSPERFCRATGVLQHLDYAGQRLASIGQPVSVASTRAFVPKHSPPVSGGTPRYILICSFLI